MGLKHSGKTSLARLAGRDFGLEVSDLDEVIARIGRDRFSELSGIVDHAACVRALYHQVGQTGFQELEAEAARQVIILSDKPRILALGGGVMENSPAMAVLRSQGFILFLDVPCELLYARIVRGGIPAFLDPQRPEAHFQEIYLRRRSLSLEYADRILALEYSSLEEAHGKVQHIIKEFLNAR